MKIVSIKPCNDINELYNSNITDYIEQLLAKKLPNDFLFDKYLLSITITNDKDDDIHSLHKSFLYRRLWESVYIKMENMSTYNFYDTHEEVELKISLAEAITFIRVATPPSPSLQALIPEATKSIAATIDTLKQFLIDGDINQPITYHSIFKRIMHFEKFDTVMADPKIPDDIENKNGLCYVELANIPVSEIVGRNDSFDNHHLNANLLFKFNSNSQIHKFIYAAQYLTILNVYEEPLLKDQDPSTATIYVSTYYHGHHQYINEYIISCIKAMYKGYI